MAAKKTTALATVESFHLVDRYADLDPELLEELQDELEDLGPDGEIACRKITIPSGGGTFYQVQDDDGEEEPAKEILGVVIYTHLLNAYWPGAFGEDNANRVPLCSSMDGKTGVNTENGEVNACDACPFNQYGTGTDQKGNPSRGKACKNMRRLFLVMDGDPNVYQLTVPPTSIKDVGAQMKKILAAGTAYTGMVVRLTLEKVKNAGGTDYAKVKIEKAGLLPPAAAAKAKELRRQIKAQHKEFTITLGDYVTAPAAESASSAPAGNTQRAGSAVDVSAEDFNDGESGYQEATAAQGDEDLPFA